MSRLCEAAPPPGLYSLGGKPPQGPAPLQRSRDNGCDEVAGRSGWSHYVTRNLSSYRRFYRGNSGQVEASLSASRRLYGRVAGEGRSGARSSRKLPNQRESRSSRPVVWPLSKIFESLNSLFAKQLVGVITGRALYECEFALRQATSGGLKLN